MRSILPVLMFAAFALPAADQQPPGLPVLGPLIELTPRSGDKPQVVHLRSFKDGVLEVLKDGRTHTVKSDEIAALRFIPPEPRPLEREPDREPGPNQPDFERPDRPDRPGEPRRPAVPLKEIRRYRELYREKLEGKLDEKERQELEVLGGNDNGRPIVPNKMRMGIEAEEEARLAKAQGKLDDYIEKWTKILVNAVRDEDIKLAVAKLVSAYRVAGTVGHMLMEKMADVLKRSRPDLKDQVDERMKELREFVFMPQDNGMRRDRPDNPDRMDREPMPPPPNGKESRERPKP